MQILRAVHFRRSDPKFMTADNRFGAVKRGILMIKQIVVAGAIAVSATGQVFAGEALTIGGPVTQTSEIGNQIAAAIGRGATAANAAASVAAQGRIDGSVTQSAEIDNQIAAAIGRGASARNSAASVTGSVDIGGDVDQRAVIDNQIAAAIGRGACAGNAASSVSSDTHCFGR